MAKYAGILSMFFYHVWNIRISYVDAKDFLKKKDFGFVEFCPFWHFGSNNPIMAYLKTWFTLWVYSYIQCRCVKIVYEL
jgi:hypothetical protein